MAIDKKLGVVITAFIALLIGVVLLQPIANSERQLTQLESPVNESITITSASGDTANDDTTVLTRFGNGSNSTDDSTITIDVNVNLSNNGTVVVDGTKFSDGTYDISYTYRHDNFVANTTATTLTRLVILFFALAIVLAGVGFFRNIGDDMLKP